MLRLEYLRKKEGLSQMTLAEQLNMTQQRISAYEKEKREPDIETLKQLADYFNCSIDYLLGYSDIRKPTTQTQASISDYGEGSQELLEHYSKLNDVGKKKAVENVRDLSENPRYTEEKENSDNIGLLNA